MAKICCGGFYLGEGLELDGRTLKATGGSGLPDPSELPDGTAIVAVNGEWKMQDGYGYTLAPAFEPIEWDGDKEGRASVANSFYKVSNIPIRKSEIIGSTFYYSIGEEPPVSETIEETEDISDDAYIAGAGGVLVAFAPGEVSGMTIPEAGVYFVWTGSGEYSLTAPPSVHQFDSALIPSNDDSRIAIFYLEGEHVGNIDFVDIEGNNYESMVAAHNSGKSIFCHVNLSLDLFDGVIPMAVVDSLGTPDIKFTGTGMRTGDFTYEDASIAILLYTLFITQEGNKIWVWSFEAQNDD